MADSTPAPGRPTRLFQLLWGFDALVASTVVFFFVWGLADGSVSSFNITLWLGMLAGLGVVLFGSLGLRNRGQTSAAVTLLLVLACPGLLAVIFLGAVLILQPRWN